MSEQAPEPATGGGGGGGAGGFLKRKLGPFPMWAWLAIGAAVILGYVVIKSRQSSASSGAGQAPATSTADGSTPAADIPQFVNQVYTTVTPPTATPPPAAVTTPPPVTTNPGGPVAPAPRPTQITASGLDTGDINRIAQQYGLTEKQLIAANPNLRKDKVTVKGKSVPLIGSGAPVPKGTVLKIPAA